MSDREFIIQRLRKVAGRPLKTDLDRYQSEQELDELVDDFPEALEVLADALIEGELELDESRTGGRSFGLVQLLEWLRDRGHGPQVSTDLLLSYLDHPADPVRESAIALLVEQGPGAVRPVISQLRVSSARAQIAAAAVIRRLGASEAVEVIEEQLTREKSGAVRQTLEETLAALREGPGGREPEAEDREPGAGSPSPVVAAGAETQNEEPPSRPPPDGEPPSPPHRPAWIAPPRAVAFGDVRLGEVWEEPDGTLRWPGRRNGEEFVLSQIETWLLLLLGRHVHRVVPAEALAREINLSLEEVHARIDSLRRKLEADPDRPRHLFVAHGLGYRFELKDEVFTVMTSPPAAEVDRAVAAGDVAALDQLLAATGETLPDGGPEPPEVRWRSGEPLSSGAAAWLIRRTLDRDPGVKLVRPALNDGDCGALAIWLLDRPRPHDDLRGLEVLADDAFTHHVAQRFEARELTLSQMRGFTWPMTPAVLRWSHRWRRRRNAPSIRTMFRPGPHTLPVESAWPAGDDPSGSATEWGEWMAEVLEDAMASEHFWLGLEFRRAFLENPLASEVCHGVIFARHRGRGRGKGKPFVVGAGGPEGLAGEAVELELDDRVRVMHSFDNLARLARGHGQPPFPQADRPIFALKDMPDVPFLDPLPAQTWLQRLRQWRFENGPAEEIQRKGRPSFHRTFRDSRDYGELRLELHHSGYTSRRPVEPTMALARRSGEPVDWDKVPQPVLSEMILDLLRLFDLLPHVHEEAGDDVPDVRRPGADLLEPAPSGRAKCRRCEGTISKGEWRFGEALLNPYSTRGRVTHRWYHLDCAIIALPAALLACLERTEAEVPGRDQILERLGAKPKPKRAKRKKKRAKAKRPPQGEQLTLGLNDAEES